MTNADIEALVAQGLLPEKGTPDVVGGAAFSLRQGGKYPEASFKDSKKRWAVEWFMVANPAPGLPPRTGLSPVRNARWEEKPTDEEMVEVELLLAELQKLKAEKLTGAAVALSFTKWLTQPILERVHPEYEYSGREDPTRGQNRKVSRGEAHKRVTLIVSGEVRDKGCLKAYCLKRPTTEEKIMSFWCPAPLLEGQQGKAVDPPAGLAMPAADVGSYSSGSSIGAQQDGVTPRGRSSTPPGASRVGTEAVEEKAGLTTPKMEEEDQGEERWRLVRSPAWVAQSLPSAVPLKPSFSKQGAGRRASFSGEQRKAEECTRAAKGKVPREKAVVTKEALVEAARSAAKATEALADLSRRAASQLEVGDGSAGRVLQLEEELQALKRYHSEALKKQSAKLKGLAFSHLRVWSPDLPQGVDAWGCAELKEANETMARELKVVVAANEELHRLRDGAEGQESLTKQKLQLEKQCFQGGVPFGQRSADLDHLMAKIDAVLVAFEPEGVALAEEVAQRLDGAREHLKAFVRNTAKDSV
ncbi:hypothetical protein C2845_PM07G10810 [Panicum miliaceum]|uniref:Uncharacterized protein n=1 Tax=Panicum miliaceum TaxID=4540 RepID=A0A3L6SJ86_PANMI|nr:hypothetical protein C2845_PM07G10810 [Panicum miliaceum]